MPIVRNGFHFSGGRRRKVNIYSLEEPAAQPRTAQPGIDTRMGLEHPFFLSQRSAARSNGNRKRASFGTLQKESRTASDVKKAIG